MGENESEELMRKKELVKERITKMVNKKAISKPCQGGNSSDNYPASLQDNLKLW
jgi:hypothetical protein